MKKFISKIVWFSLPIAVVLLVPVITLRSYKENFYHIDEVVKTDQDYLIGYAYNENNYKYLKYKVLTEIDRVNVWAVGSSRSLQFRREMFSKSFYNAGYTITTIKDFVPFLKSISPDKYPDILIVNLDQWMFNENYDQLKSTPNVIQWTDAFTEFPSYKTIVNVWTDVFQYKYSLLNNGDVKNIGLNAAVNNRGFRPDGSMYYGNQVEKLLVNDSTANDFEFKDTFNRIRFGSNRFQYGKEFNSNTVEEVKNLLLFCRVHDIELIAFLPPYAPRVYEVMSASGEYAYMDSIQSNLIDLFRSREYSLYDFTNPTQIQSNDDEFIDGFHGGEKTYARILLEMLKTNEKLSEYVNSDRLRRDIDSANPLILYN